MLHLQEDWYLKGATKENQATSKFNHKEHSVLNVWRILKKNEMETNWLSRATVLQSGVRWVLIHSVKMFINSIKLILLDHCDSLDVLFHYCSHADSSGCVCVWIHEGLGWDICVRVHVSDPVRVCVLAWLDLCGCLYVRVHARVCGLFSVEWGR